jgi:hypothetical protein
VREGGEGEGEKVEKVEKEHTAAEAGKAINPHFSSSSFGEAAFVSSSVTSLAEKTMELLNSPLPILPSPLRSSGNGDDTNSSFSSYSSIEPSPTFNPVASMSTGSEIDAHIEAEQAARLIVSSHFLSPDRSGGTSDSYVHELQDMLAAAADGSDSDDGSKAGDGNRVGDGSGGGGGGGEHQRYSDDETDSGCEYESDNTLSEGDEQTQQHKLPPLQLLQEGADNVTGQPLSPGV